MWDGNIGDMGWGPAGTDCTAPGGHFVHVFFALYLFRGVGSFEIVGVVG